MENPKRSIDPSHVEGMSSDLVDQLPETLHHTPRKML